MIFDKVYELPLAKTYCNSWGVPEAVRELLQNALDSESPFDAKFYGNNLTITSKHSRLEPKTLLLGITTKADAEDKIGQFGEGYKIALLVLAREGVSVKVINDGLYWEPEFKYSKTFEEEVLTIREKKDASSKGCGLSFILEDLQDYDRQDIINNTLHMQADLGDVLETSQGNILKDRPGKLYVKGLFVCETELKYGYDIKPEFLSLERDRRTVSDFDLAFLAKDMWFQTGKNDLIAEMMEFEFPDMEYANYQTPEVVKEACYKLFQQRYPGAIAAENQKELEELVERGMEKVVVVSGSFGSTIRACRSYQHAPKVQVKSPHLKMSEWLSANRGDMRKGAIVSFKILLADAKLWRLQ